jgi:hypothetical protein
MCTPGRVPKKHEKSMKNGSENAMFWDGKTF